MEMYYNPSLTAQFGGSKNESFKWQARDTFPSLAIPSPPLKLLPNMGHLSLATPLLAASSIATLPKIIV